MLVRYGQAAMLAAILILAMNSARAEDAPAKGACGACCKDKDCCTADKCCKTDCKCEGCGKDGKCCCKDNKCCGTDGKCCKGGECCASKQCCKGACGCSCCTAKGKHAKKAPAVGPILVFVPVPMAMTMTPPTMPVCAGCPAGYGAMPMPVPPPPVMPPQSVGLPIPPPPPCYACPASMTHCSSTPCPVDAAPQQETGVDICLSILGMAADLCSSPAHPPSLPAMCVSALGLAIDMVGETSAPNMTLPSGQYLQHLPQYPPSAPQCPVAILPPPTPCDGASYGCSASPTLPMQKCCAVSPAPAAAKVRIVAKSYSDRLEMFVGDDACMTCKRMVVKVGDNALTLSRIDDQVRVRAADLRAKADCIRTDRKDRVVLEGDVELHYSKDGQSTKVTAERVELNLTTGAVTIEPATVERIGVNFR